MRTRCSPYNSQTPLCGGVRRPGSLHTPYRVVPRPISLLTWTRADDASSHPGRAPESTWTSTYREAEVAQGEPEAEEAQGAEDWVPPKQYWNFHYYPDTSGLWSKCGGEVDFDQLVGKSEPRHA